MKHVVTGLLAHVDAGKTTLSEAMLYKSGTLRHMGRVDHQDAFLDYDEQERNRGITIYSKQASLEWKDIHLDFVDTPGHVDFSSEMERTLQVLDYAILIISGIDGIQAHTETIWNLLKAYEIPVFIFVNKMDISYDTNDEIMEKLKSQLDSNCINFMQNDAMFYEEVSISEDTLLEKYLQQDTITKDDIASAIERRFIFPVYFGSALKLEGIENLLDGISTYMTNKEYPSEFGAKIYKVTYDEQGNRLAHVKVTGGTLQAKTKLSETEKVDQIRIYEGNKFQVVQEVKAGDLCVIEGLKELQAGDGLGFEENNQISYATPVMNYHMVLPKEVDAFDMMRKLKTFMEEDPQLHISYHELENEIRVQIMGEVQMEILKHKIFQKLGVLISFDEGRVNYKETILNTVEGVGHFEPLRHYAEVHLLLEPLPQGSGIQVDSDISMDLLDRHWQRLILSHIKEKEHIGVLIGAPITDMKITLISGKSHVKHTDAGDFRQATYRAIRQGLRKAESILLEPYYQFQLTIPTNYMSRAIFDLENMNATFRIADQQEKITIIKGEAAVAKMQSYPITLRSYTQGKGKLQCKVNGYRPCENMEEVIMKMNYDPDRDIRNSCDSVFCAHGSGFNVPWNMVEQYMHIPLRNQAIKEEQVRKVSHKVDDAELKRVFESIYGKEKVKKRTTIKKRPEVKSTIVESVKILPECILVDGYNMIFGWSTLKQLAKEHMDTAKHQLINILNNYQGYRKCEIILVFDAYKRKQHDTSITKEGNIHVVYTKTSQTADSYIEMTTHKLAKDYRVRVATSDGLEQLIVIGQGAVRISALEFEKEIMACHAMEIKEYEKNQPVFRNQALEDIRNFHKN